MICVHSANAWYIWPWKSFMNVLPDISELLLGLFANVFKRVIFEQVHLLRKFLLRLCWSLSKILHKHEWSPNPCLAQKFVRQKYSSDKIDKILAWWRKFCQTKTFVGQNFVRCNILSTFSPSEAHSGWLLAHVLGEQLQTHHHGHQPHGEWKGEWSSARLSFGPRICTWTDSFEVILTTFCIFRKPLILDIQGLLYTCLFSLNT